MIIISCLAGCNQQKEEVEQWDVFEVVLNGPSSGTPYMDVELSAVFKNREESIQVPGFYDGSGIYRIRFSPQLQGDWTYQTESNITELSIRREIFIVSAPPVRITVP